MSGGTCCQGIVEAVSGFLLLTRLVVWRDRLTHVMKEGQTWVPAGLAFSGQYGGETRPPRGLHPVEKASRPQWVLLCLRPVLGAEGTGVTPTLADGASDSGCNVCFRDSMLGEDVLPTLPRDHPPPNPASWRRRHPDFTPARVSPGQCLWEAHKASPIQGTSCSGP